MAQTIKFELNGKIYNYPYVIVSVSNPDNVWWGSSRIIRGDFVSLFEFLELEKRIYSLEGKINNVPCTISVIKDVSTSESLGIYRANITANGNTMMVNSKVNENVLVTDNNARFSGAALAYNIATDTWGSRIGCSSFIPSGDSMSLPARYVYSTDLIGSGTLQLNYKRLESNTVYKAIYFSQYDNANYYTSNFPANTTQITTFMKGLNFKTPIYPDQNPDNENGSDGQPPSDFPLPGDGDTSSDPIPDPPRLPVFDVSNTGFVVIYNPNVQEIRELASFMWSGDFADLIKKVFAEPFAALISLKMLFVQPVVGASQTVWLGNVETTVSMSKITQQFVDMDMGSITINEFFGSFADYAPFTKIQIFLPFIGYKDLNVDEVMNSQLHLQYRIDVYSGACIAFLTVTKDIKSTHLDSILYQFDGNCAMEIPFTSNDNSRYVAAILNSAASSALSLAGSSTFTQAQSPYMFDKGESAKLTIGSLAPVANGLLDIMSTKPNVQRAGSLAGAVAAMGVKQPYIVIHRPIAHMPGNYQHYIGIPLNLSRTLSDVKGYTIVSQVFMSSATATDEEIEMITEMLKAGVIF